MRDEWRMCARCEKKHRWGVIGRRSGVPLYNAKPTRWCDKFKPMPEQEPPDLVNFPVQKSDGYGVPTDQREIWAQTPELNAQATMATRIAILRLKSLAKGKTGYAAMAAQWPEFVGYVVSQITDMRGNLVGANNAALHLNAHADEVVEAMRKSTQLAEQLGRMNSKLGEIVSRLDGLEEAVSEPAPDQIDAEAFAHFGLIEPSMIGFYQSLSPVNRRITESIEREDEVHEQGDEDEFVPEEWHDPDLDEDPTLPEEDD